MYKVGRSRTPQGVRGLKQIARRWIGLRAGRTPQGVRGLKRGESVPGAAEQQVALRKECVD